MKKNKFAALLFAFILIIPSIFSSVHARNTLFEDFVITSRKIKTKIVKKDVFPQRTLPEKKWNNLRTTYVPGVYCQQGDDYGTYRRQRHFYYNTKNRQMVEIPGKYFISSPKDLGELENDYELYGNKSDTFTHNGKTYKIPTIR